MHSILDLWNGDIAPCEHCGAHDPEANHLFSLICKNREILWAELSAPQRDRFQKYMDVSEEYLFRMMELAFCDGFTLASRLSVDTLL